MKIGFAPPCSTGSESTSSMNSSARSRLSSGVPPYSTASVRASRSGLEKTSAPCMGISSMPAESMSQKRLRFFISAVSLWVYSPLTPKVFAFDSEPKISAS